MIFNKNLPMKEYLILILLVFGLQANLRFSDEEMMKEHHNHPYPQNGPNITVHLIPHSHDDVGWLKTVDQYYYGASQNIQWAGVQYTIDTVVSELSAHSQYKFSIVETAFLYRWWNNANETQRSQLKQLIKNEQIQIINGGWCMSDEATPYYEDVVDQMAIGLRWLKQTLDVIPKVGWHIDPFGHQASTASMFSKMGFNSFFFSRIDYQDKQLRMANKNLQMIWRPTSTVPDPKNYIFTQVNYYHYSPPPGFCFDLLCKDQPIKDDPTMEEYNIVSRSEDFVNYFKSMALHFRSTNLMHTMGEDFHYANARMWYKNIDKLIKFINSRPQYGVKIQYSTPGLYTEAINKEGATYPLKNDDFFPYADRQNAYWTGYFTSRVAVKGFVRDFGRWLQATRKLISELKFSKASTIIADNAKALEQGIWNMQTSMGILQHHDAVSGTEKQKVANDYIATALKYIGKFSSMYKQIIAEQIKSQMGETISESEIYMNMYWNETAKQTGVADKISAGKAVLLALYNPGPAQKRIIKINVPNKDLKIVDWTNQPITGDVFCANLYDTANCQLIFSASLPESANFYIKIIGQSKNPTAKVQKLKQLGALDNTKEIKLSSTASIKITKATQKFDITLDGTVESFTVNYNYYESYQGSDQKSGAYIFRPASNTAKKFSTIKTISYAEGVKSVVFTLAGDRTSTKLTFSKEDGYVNKYGFEVQTRIDSIEITDKVGKEVTLNFATNFLNNKTFYTDSNGLEEQTRIVNYRPTWPLIVNEQVSGNYYPVNSHIGFEDIHTKKRLTILTDRSEGATSIKEGEIELMIHRRTLYDDARGVGQPLNETDADGKGLRQIIRHYVVIGDSYRSVQMHNDQKVMVNLASTTTSTFTKHTPRACPIKVPNGVKLYLRPFEDNSYLLRVQNFNQQQASFTVPDGWTAVEYTLSANQLQADWEANRMQWKEEKSESVEKEKEELSILQKAIQFFKSIYTYFFPEGQEDNDAVKLNFLQIRTYKLIVSS